MTILYGGNSPRSYEVDLSSTVRQRAEILFQFGNSAADDSYSRYFFIGVEILVIKGVTGCDVPSILTDI